MKKSTIFIILAMTIGLVLGVAVSNARDTFVELERNGIKLQVPERYIYEKRFSWVNKTKGLDSDKDSFLISVPADEVKNLLPKSVSSSTLEPINLIVGIYLLSDVDRQTMQNNKQVSFEEIAQRKQYFSEAYEELDTETGWHKVYQSPKLTSRWYVFLQSLYSGEQAVNTDNLIALCHDDEYVGKQCKMTAALFDDVAIEMNLRYEHLPYYKKIQSHVVDLLSSWRQ